MCLVGMVMQFAERNIISGVITMGQILAIAPVVVFGYAIARRLGRTRDSACCWALVSGLFSGVVLAAFCAYRQCR